MDILGLSENKPSADLPGFYAKSLNLGPVLVDLLGSLI